MAAKNISKSIANEVETAGIRIEEGLRALNVLAKQCRSGLSTGIPLDALAVCVEQMTHSMLQNVQTLYEIADRR